MWSPKIKSLLKRSRHKPKIIILIDPDKFDETNFIFFTKHQFVNLFFVGGSQLNGSSVHTTIRKMKKHTQKPIIIFPGDETQISPLADGILFLSLVSGRNAEYLIEKQIKAAPVIQKYALPFLPTAYLLIDGNNLSTTQKITNTSTLPQDKKSIYTTCLAASMLGMQAIYLEAGSGAQKTIHPKIIHYIKKKLNLPLIVGGGISSVHHIEQYLSTPVDALVIGNALEKNPLFLNDIKRYFQWK